MALNTTARSASQSEADKVAKKSAADKRNRVAARFILEAIAQGIQRGHNTMTSEQFNLVLNKAVQVQIFLKEGQRGSVERNRKNKETGEVETYQVDNAPLTFRQHTLFDQADMQKAFAQGKVLVFCDLDGNPVAEVSKDDEE